MVCDRSLYGCIGDGQGQLFYGRIGDGPGQLFSGQTNNVIILFVGGVLCSFYCIEWNLYWDIIE